MTWIIQQHICFGTALRHQEINLKPTFKQNSIQKFLWPSKQVAKKHGRQFQCKAQQTQKQAQQIDLNKAHKFMNEQPEGGKTFELRSCDLILHGHTGQEVLVFGVNHYQALPQIGDIILQNNIKALICETSITPKHGANIGEEFNPEKHWDDNYDQFLKDIMSYSIMIINEGGIKSKIWQDMRASAPGEMSAYVAAMAKNVPIIHGDRPKPVTYRRLMGKLTEVDLDRAYEKRVQQNYVDQLLSQGVDVTHLVELDELIKDDIVDDIMLNERDAVMCFITDQQVKRTSVPTIVCVGYDHLAKFERYWKSGEWKDMYRRALQEPPPDLVKRESQNGFKRALLYSVINLIAPPSTLYDINELLDDVQGGEEQNKFNLTYSLYCNTRMFLACCQKDLLGLVWSPLKEGDSIDSLYNMLGDFRKSRISQGGVGYSDALVEKVVDNEKAFHRWVNTFDKIE